MEKILKYNNWLLYYNKNILELYDKLLDYLKYNNCNLLNNMTFEEFSKFSYLNSSKIYESYS